jgi:hypothetical protein
MTTPLAVVSTTDLERWHGDDERQGREDREDHHAAGRPRVGHAEPRPDGSFDLGNIYTLLADRLHESEGGYDPATFDRLMLEVHKVLKEVHAEARKKAGAEALEKFNARTKAAFTYYLELTNDPTAAAVLLLREAMVCRGGLIEAVNKATEAINDIDCS